MAPDQLSDLARQFLNGECSVDAFVKSITDSASSSPSSQFATVDVDRQQRCGFPEVIFGEGKTPEMVAAIAQQLLDRGQPVLATRIDAAKAAAICGLLSTARYNTTARTI